MWLGKQTASPTGQSRRLACVLAHRLVVAELGFLKSKTYGAQMFCIRLWVLSSEQLSALKMSMARRAG